MNPVRAGIVEDPKDYRWSSYNAYAYGKGDVIVDKHHIYKRLSADEAQRRRQYRELVRGMIKKNKAMRGEMDRRVIYGSDAFIAKMSEEHKISPVTKHRGRPRKDETGNK